jgi:hypothetical protein
MMVEEIEKEKPEKLNLKYKREAGLQTVKLFIKNKEGKCEAYLKEEMADKKTEDFEEESISFIRVWFNLDQNLQRASTMFGMRDNALYTKLLIMYRLKGLSFISAEQWQTEKDDVGVERMAPSFADEVLGASGLPVEVVNAILRAINTG